MKLNERGTNMKKLNEKELSKITGGFGMFFDPTVSFYMKRKKGNVLSSLLKLFKK